MFGADPRLSVDSKCNYTLQIYTPTLIDTSQYAYTLDANTAFLTASFQCADPIKMGFARAYGLFRAL